MNHHRRRERNATRPGQTDLSSPTPSLQQRLCVCIVERAVLLFEMLKRSKWKYTGWMKNTLLMFLKPEKLVMKASSHNFAIAQFSMRLSKPRTFSRLAVNLRYISEAIPQLILTYIWQELSKMTKADVDKLVVSLFSIYISVVEMIETQECPEFRKVLERNRSVQTSLPYILYHLNMYFWDGELFKAAKNVSEKKWSSTRQATIHMYDISSLLTVDHRPAGIIWNRRHFIINTLEQTCFLCILWERKTR